MAIVFLFYSNYLNAQELPINDDNEVEFEYIGETNMNIKDAKEKLLENMRQNLGLKETIEDGEDYFIIRLQSIARLGNGLSHYLMSLITYMCRFDFKENRFRSTWYSMTFADTKGVHKIENLEKELNKRNRRLIKEKIHSEFSEWKDYLDKAFEKKEKKKDW